MWPFKKKTLQEKLKSQVEGYNPDAYVVILCLQGHHHMVYDGDGTHIGEMLQDFVAEISPTKKIEFPYHG